MVSELFTHAGQHAGAVTGFRLGPGPRTGTVVEVQDASTTPPRPLRRDAGKQGGVGWHLVQDLSDDVQVHVHAAGKTVAAILPCSTGVMPQG